MQCSKLFVALSILLATSIAAPLEEGPAVENVILDKKSIGKVAMFSTDTCGGSSRTYNYGTGANVCIKVPFAVRSIYVEGDCTVRTYSGTDCHGSTSTPKHNSCVNVLYGSVTVFCP